MAGFGRQESIIKTRGEARRRDPVDGPEKLEVDFALDVEVHVHSSILVKDEIPDRVRALNF